MHVVTAEPEPLAAFGAWRQRGRGGAARGGAECVIHAPRGRRCPRPRKLVVQPEGRELEPERIVAMPRIRGPRIRGVPADDDGFIPIDELSRVRGLEPRVFAAGDAANLQIKHGGLGAQMADTAAAGIAALAGADVEVGAVAAGAARRALHRRASRSTSRRGSRTGGWIRGRARPPWPADEKVVAEELGPSCARSTER